MIIVNVVTERTMLLVMEFVSNGCLRDYLKKHKDTRSEELLRYCYEIVEVPYLRVLSS